MVLGGFKKQMVAAQEGFNYKEALSKAIMFLECQRSGKLPPTNRIPWRGDSALEEGSSLMSVSFIQYFFSFFSRFCSQENKNKNKNKNAGGLGRRIL